MKKLMESHRKERMKKANRLAISNFLQYSFAVPGVRNITIAAILSLSLLLRITATSSRYAPHALASSLRTTSVKAFVWNIWLRWYAGVWLPTMFSTSPPGTCTWFILAKYGWSLCGLIPFQQLNVQFCKVFYSHHMIPTQSEHVRAQWCPEPLCQVLDATLCSRKDGCHTMVWSRSAYVWKSNIRMQWTCFAHNSSFGWKTPV